MLSFFTGSRIGKFNRIHNIEYGPEGYYIMNTPSENKKVTVITPVFNAEKYLRKTVDSVLRQSMGIDHIEYILVDDGSTDSSRQILLEYGKKHPSIVIVFLERNTGTPGKPRNLGINLSSSPYITFLDADDWLHPDALKNLYNILEETQNDYVVGRTVQVGSKSSKIIGEHESCKERRNVPPQVIPHIFQHLGPRARMIRAHVIKNHNLEFPEMKYAEDKQFFIDVLSKCRQISTTKNTIYYLNRMDENNSSLTKQTNILQKMDSNIKVIHYVRNKQLDEVTQKMVLNRLYEFDSITRLFNRDHFFTSKEKERYFAKFNEVLKTMEGLSYDVSELFFHPINRLAFQLYTSGRYKELEELFKWDKNEKNKEYIIRDNLPYAVIPFLEGDEKYLRVPMMAFHKKDYVENGKYYLVFDVYGEHIKSVTDILLRDRVEIENELSLPVHVDERGNGTLEVDVEMLYRLPSSSYILYLRYNDYNKIHIRKPLENKLKFDKREFIFYTTINSNMGFKIK